MSPTRKPKSAWRVPQAAGEAVGHHRDQRWSEFYDRWAPTYDLITGFWALVRGFSDSRERRRMVRRLRLKPDDRALEVSVGTGSNLPLMAEAAGRAGRLVGLDISRGMMRQAQGKLRRRRLRADLVEGEAAALPFADGSFDAVLHFGGMNEFGDIPGAVREMMRVAKPGVRIVIGAESLKPEKRDTFWGRLLIRFNPRYAIDTPLGALPPEAKDVRVRWFRGDECYLIDFQNGAQPAA